MGVCGAELWVDLPSSSGDLSGHVVAVSRGLREESSDLLVAGWIEHLVALAHSHEIVRNPEDHQLLHERSHPGHGIAWGDGDGEEEVAGVLLPQGQHGGMDGGAGGHAVVDHHHGATGYVGRADMAAVEEFASAQLGLFPVGDPSDVGLADPGVGDDVLVEDPDPG